MIYMLILLCSMGSLLNALPESKAKQEVLAAMNTWRLAMMARDRAALEKIYAPGLSYSHSNGKQENRAEAIEAVVNGKDRIESIELKDISVVIYGTTALVKAKITMRMTDGDSATILNLDVLHVWIKSSSNWQMVARHAMRLNP